MSFAFELRIVLSELKATLSDCNTEALSQDSALREKLLGEMKKHLKKMQV